MSYRRYPWENLLDDLAGRPLFGLPPFSEQEKLQRREDCYDVLRAWTEQDFGYNEDAWRAWMIENLDWDLELNPEFESRLEKIRSQRKNT